MAQRLLTIAGLSAAAVLALGVAPAARATFPGHDGQLAVESFRAGSGGSEGYQGRDLIESRQLTFAACTVAPGAQSMGCALGRPSWSPDGRAIAFARRVPVGATSARRAPGRLTVADARGAGARTLPALTADDEQPAFLPGGRTLVFTGRSAVGARPDLYRVATDGTGLVRLTTRGGEAPAPCAGGAIAFVRGRTLRLRTRTGAVRTLASGGASAPSCRPDGRAVAFARGGAILQVGVGGHGLRRLVRVPFAGPATDPEYAPEGTQLAYVAPAGATTLAAHTVGLDGHRGAPPLLLTVGVLPSPGVSSAHAAASTAGLAWQPSVRPVLGYRRLPGVLSVGPDPAETSIDEFALGDRGRTVAAATYGSTLQVARLRIAGGRVRTVSRASFPGAGRGPLAVSPDGREVVDLHEGGTIIAYRVDPATGRVARVAGLTSVGGGLTDIAFAPSGRLVAALRGNGRLVMLRVARGSGRLIVIGHRAVATSRGGTQDVAFAPDSRTLAVSTFTPPRSPAVVIFRVTGDGRLSRVPGAPYGIPSGTLGDAWLPLTFTTDGHLLLSPSSLDLDVDGDPETLFTSPVGRPGFRALAGGPQSPADIVPFSQDSHFIQSAAAISPDGSVQAVLVGGFTDQPTVMEPDRTPGILLVPLRSGLTVPPGPIPAPPFSPDVATGLLGFADGGRLLAEGAGGHIVLYARTGQSTRGGR